MIMIYMEKFLTRRANIFLYLIRLKKGMQKPIVTFNTPQHKKKRLAISFIFLLIGVFSDPINAALDPLRVAVSQFLPPFVIQGANHELSGYDITLMNYICKTLNRKCTYKPMANNDILMSVANNTVDVGIGALTITLERYKLVNFSIPYLLSESRFITNKKLAAVPFSLPILSNKTIGVEEGTLFGRQLLQMLQIKNPNIVLFHDVTQIISALNDGSIDAALVDNSTALYWQNHSSGALYAVGKPYLFGFGLGIAVNQNNTVLTQAINLVILQYQQTNEFKQMYNMYFGGF